MKNSNNNFPSVYIIILNWNHKDDLLETIESFKKQDYPNFKLVISDNGSADDSVETVKRNYNEIVVIENKENLGWAAGNNIGIKYALEKNADLILLSNNDIELSNDKLLSNLISSFQVISKKINIGAFGCKENYFSQRDKTYNDGWNMFPKAVKKNKKFNIYKEDNYELNPKYKVVDFVSGSFVLIKLFYVCRGD